MWDGKRLRDLREKFRYTQDVLAEKINVSYQQVWRWESGKNEPTSTTLVKLAKIFHVSTDYLLGISASEVYAPEDREALNPLETRMINALREEDTVEALRVLAEWVELRQTRFLENIGDIPF